MIKVSRNDAALATGEGLRRSVKSPVASAAPLRETYSHGSTSHANEDKDCQRTKNYVR